MIEGGPYLQTAALCERFLEEKDNVLTLVRLIDQVFLPVATPASGITYLPIPVWAILTFKSGQAQGTRTVTLKTPPDLGLKRPNTSIDVTFQGGVTGVNVMIQLGITPGAAKDGEHWLDVVLDDQVVTRIPLRITYRAAENSDPQAALSEGADLDADAV